MFGAVAAGVPTFGDLAWKASARAAAYGGLPANGYAAGVLTASVNGVLAAQDGVTLVVGDRVLVPSEGVASHDGVYVVTSVGSAGTPWVLTRSTDCDEASEMVAGATVLVTGGTRYAGTFWTALAAWTPTSGTPTWRTWAITALGVDTIVHPQPDQSDATLLVLAAAGATAALAFDAGTGTGDARIRRNAAKSLRVDDAAAGAATLDVTGTLSRGTEPVLVKGATGPAYQAGSSQVGGSIAAGGTRTDTITLPSAFADANYVVVVTAQLPGFTADMCYMELQGAPVAASFSVRTVNKDSSARQPVIHWVAIHN